jgi:hypothetical protein
MLAVWQPLSAPGATIFDQHDDAPRHATTRQDDAFGATWRHVNRYVFTPAGPSAAGGGATLYVFYDSFD